MKFLLFVIIIFSVIGLLCGIGYLFLKFLFTKYEEILLIAFNKYANKRKRVKVTYLHPVVFAAYFVTTAVFIVCMWFLIMGNAWFLIAVIFYPFWIIFLGTLLRVLEYPFHAEKKKRKSAIRLKRLKSPYISYIISRGKILFQNAFTVLSVMMIILYLFGECIQAFYQDDIPMHVLYAFFLFIPILMALFNYIRVKSKTDLQIRRMLSYFLILAFSVGETYIKLLDLYGVESKEDTLYVFFVVLTIFTATDNLLHVLCSDWKSYREKKD